jgi:hypothetical protein
VPCIGVVAAVRVEGKEKHKVTTWDDNNIIHTDY